MKEFSTPDLRVSQPTPALGHTRLFVEADALKEIENQTARLLRSKSEKLLAR